MYYESANLSLSLSLNNQFENHLKRKAIFFAWFLIPQI